MTQNNHLFYLGDRVQWFRAQADMERWQEEVEILEEEFRRAIRGFEKMEQVWSSLAMSKGFESEILIPESQKVKWLMERRRRQCMAGWQRRLAWYFIQLGLPTPQKVFHWEIIFDLSGRVKKSIGPRSVV
jgi:hypothetical protein